MSGSWVGRREDMLLEASKSLSFVEMIVSIFGMDSLIHDKSGIFSRHESTV